MQHLCNKVISLATIVTAVCGSLSAINSGFEEEELDNVFGQILGDIMKQRTFYSMLLIHPIRNSEPRLGVLYKFHVPKMIKTKEFPLKIIEKFNTEMLVVVIMTQSFEVDLLESAAQTLDYKRQARMLVIAWNSKTNCGEFRKDLLEACLKFKITNVLLIFGHSVGELFWRRYYKLHPYPKYHWSENNVNETNEVYFPQHWRNMHNKTIVTFTDQIPPRTVLTKDAQGNLKINGYVARLILLFAERYNASLEMCCPLKMGELLNFNVVNKMVDKLVLDIPMTADVVLDGKWTHRSYIYDIGSGFLILPCSQPLSTQDIYEILLNGYFFGFITLCTLLLSIVHSLIELCFEGQLLCSNFIANDRIVPGVLGQSFRAKESLCYGLNLVYFLVFFAGLNISTQFSSNINTLFTSRPHHRAIQTFEDINRSSLKILVDASDTQATSGPLDPIANSLVFTDNTSYFQNIRQSFNTSFGYPINSATWDMLNRQQQYFTRKLYCFYDTVLLMPFIPWVIRLQPYSEYKEPLDYLIHRVHAMGFMEAWHSSTFSDMLKLDRTSIGVSNPEKVAKVLTVDDLYWVWMKLAIGLSFSGVVFLLELVRKQFSALFFNRKELLEGLNIARWFRNEIIIDDK